MLEDKGNRLPIGSIAPGVYVRQHPQGPLQAIRISTCTDPDTGESFLEVDYEDWKPLAMPTPDPASLGKLWKAEVGEEVPMVRETEPTTEWKGESNE